jgi:phage/plasmid-like protein (TIGR03299 family)
MAHIVSETNDPGQLNWVAGLSDPGEMLACGYLPQLRRVGGETDRAYQERITPLVMALPEEERQKIMGAATARANLDSSNGKVAVVVAGEPAWHGLGKNVSGAFDSDQALEWGGLDWKVSLWDVFAGPDRNSRPISVIAPDHRAVVRTDTQAVLGVVGTKYKLFQNAELGQFMDGLVGEKLAVFHTAGSLDGGKRVWMQMLLPQDYYVTPKDVTQAFVLGTMAHDGTGAIKFSLSTNRVVCQNTLRRAVAERGDGLSIRHTQSMKGKVNEARKALGLISQDMDVYAEEARAMARVKLGRSDVEKYVKTLTRTNGQPYFPTETPPEISLEDVLKATEAREEIGRELLDGYYAATERIAKKNKAILEAVLCNHDCDVAAGTAWGAYNAVSEYSDHGATFRGQGAEEKANSRLNSAWFGAGHELKQAAFQAALEMAR